MVIQICVKQKNKSTFKLKSTLFSSGKCVMAQLAQSELGRRGRGSVIEGMLCVYSRRTQVPSPGRAKKNSYQKPGELLSVSVYDPKTDV